MPAKLVKKTLRPGSYVKGGNRYHVTADDLSSFSRSFQRMSKDGLELLLTREHPADSDPEFWPVSRGTVKSAPAGKGRVAGRVTDVSLAADGQVSIEMEVDDDSEAAELTKRPAFISPGISANYVNPSTGAEYGRSFLHVALTEQPVDREQPAFFQVPLGNSADENSDDFAAGIEGAKKLVDVHFSDPAVKAKAKAQPTLVASFSLADLVDVDDSPLSTVTTFADAPPVPAAKPAAAAKSPMPPGDGEAGEEPDADDDEVPDNVDPDPTDGDTTISYQDVAAELGQVMATLNLPVPTVADPQSPKGLMFLVGSLARHLSEGRDRMTQPGQNPQPGQPQPGQPGQPGGAPVQQQPQSTTLTLSLGDTPEGKALLARQTVTDRTRFRDRLDRLRETGRVNGDTATRLENSINAYTFSADAGNHDSIEQRLADFEGNPEGTFFARGVQDEALYADVFVHGQPAYFSQSDDGEPDAEAAAKIVEGQFPGAAKSAAPVTA